VVICTSALDSSLFDVGHKKQASHHGYTGPIDGVLGENSWAGTQRGLVDYGYNGPADGVPGELNFPALCRNLFNSEVSRCRFVAGHLHSL
jgi:hypothetical protein